MWVRRFVSCTNIRSTNSRRDVGNRCVHLQLFHRLHRGPPQPRAPAGVDEGYDLCVSVPVADDGRQTLPHRLQQLLRRRRRLQRHGLAQRKVQERLRLWQGFLGVNLGIDGSSVMVWHSAEYRNACDSSKEC